MPDASRPIVHHPASYVTPVAIGVTEADGTLALIGSGAPLPVAFGTAAAGTPIAGSASVSGRYGPFAPANANPVIVTLGGTWTGTVRLVRSVDDGATVAGLMVAGSEWGAFTANGVEQAWVETESGATFYLMIELAAGTVDYRVAQ